MANELIGLVDKTTGVGLADADARYPATGDAKVFRGFHDTSEFVVSMQQAGTGSEPTQYDVIKLKRTSTNGINYTYQGKKYNILSGGVLGDVLGTDYVEVVLGNNNTVPEVKGGTHTNGGYFAYIDNGTGVLRCSNLSIDLEVVCPVFSIAWRGDNVVGKRSIPAREYHTTKICSSDHLWKHRHIGAKVRSGAELSGFTLTPTTPSSSTNWLAISAGVLDDEDLPSTLDAVAKPVANGENYTVIHRDGTGTNSWKTDIGKDFWYMPGSVGTYVGYDSDSGSIGLTDLAANNYVNYYFCVSNFTALDGGNNHPSRYFFIPGQASHSTLSAATNENPLGLNLTNLFGGLSREIVIKSKLTLRTGAGYTGVSGRCRIEQKIELNLSLNAYTTTPAQNAAAVSYNNTESGLSATNVQDAIDEVVSSIGGSNVIANTDGAGSPHILVASDSGNTYTNEGATEENYSVLPTAAAGLRFTFIVQDSDGMRITASSGDTIRVGATVSISGGYIESLDIGSSISLIAINATEWMATAVMGTWDVETS